MNKVEEKVLNTIREYNLIKENETIVIGVSGGPDSITLFNVLYNLRDFLKINIVVAHINHMLRDEADIETEYVQNFCDNKNVKCFIKKADINNISKQEKISTELAGRNVRYDFFEEVAQNVNASKIATAHTANDNAETVLMNLMRGVGTSGLKGIEVIRDEKFIRPLIDCTRNEIEEYCEDNNLNPKYDKSNDENVYTRNKIRNQLIPYIQKEFNPGIIETINRLSIIISKEEVFFHKIVEKEYSNILIHGDNSKEIILNLKKFNLLEDVIKSRVILYTIRKLMGSAQGIEKIHIEDIIKLCKNNVGNKYLMPKKNLKVYIKKGKIFFISVV